MLAALGLSLLLGAQLGTHKGSNLELIVFNSFQAGIVPYGQDTETRPTLADILTPSITYSYKSRGTSFTLNYQPRVSFELTRPQAYDRPLLLQRLNFNSKKRLSRRLQLNGETSVQVGDVDYAAVSAVFTPNISTLPDIDLLQWLHILGNYSMQYAATRTFFMGISASGDFNTPLTEASAEGLIRSATFGGSLYMKKNWDNRASSELSLPITYSWFPEQMLFIMASPTVFHKYALRKTTFLNFSLGVTGIYIVDSQEFVNLKRGETAVSPTGNILIKEIFNNGPENTFRLSGSFSYQWRIDPLLARPEKRAEATILWSWSKEPILELGTQVSFSTTLPGIDYQGAEGSPPVARNDQGALSFSVPFDTEINQHFHFTAQITSALRGPSVFEGYRPEVVAFLGSVGIEYFFERNSRR